MNTSIPQPTIGQQAQALRLASIIAAEQPLLPAPYITVHTYWSTSLGIQVDYGQFEEWREALGFDTDDVKLRTHHESWLSVSGTVVRSVDGHDVTAEVKLTGCGLPYLVTRDAERPVVEYSDGLTEAFAGITPAVTA